MLTPLADRLSQLSRSRSALGVTLGVVAILGIALLVLGRADVAAASLFHPHGYCYLWRADLVAGHVASDLFIGFSYVAISGTLLYLVRRAAGTIPFSWVFIAFGTFIVACGATHFMEVLTLWQPLFWTSMGVKIVTAVASVATAVVLPPLVPRVLELLDTARLSEGRQIALQDARDELEQRVVQEQVLRTEAQAANVKKDEFLANMSHELRTPLNVIIGFAELMHKGTVDPAAPAHQEYLGNIVTSSKHLLHLINDILDLAKVGSGTMEMWPEPVHLPQLMAEVHDLLGGLAAAKQLRIDTNVDPAVATVVADPARLRQILYNYLSNAIKFTPDDGKITIVAAPEGSTMFRIDVTDTGVGISPLGLSKLFVEFQQLDASPAKRYQGTGLGLALTKRLVEAQGGQVAARSTVGEGSTFSVILPRELAPRIEQPAHVPIGANTSRPRGSSVLVVEDNGGASKIIEVLLREAGYRPTLVATVDEALGSVAIDPPAAVIVDHLVSGAIGSRFIGELRRILSDAAVPIISWTAKDLDVQEAHQLKSAGVILVSKRDGDAGRLIGELKRRVPIERA